MDPQHERHALQAVPWPPLRLEAWKATYATLHRWTQVVGKTRLALTPPLNHWWHSTLYVTSRGLTTSPIPYGERTFEVLFDLVDHNLFVHMSDGRRKAMPLLSRSVASFYEEYQSLLRALDVDVHLWPMPVEIENPIPLNEDKEHASYDPIQANRFFRVLAQADLILKEFEGRFWGKQSPSHFFWGSFDLAQTRFSGRRAPERPGADRVTREAYSHEVMSFGFWPGTPEVTDAAFYAYAAPEPAGFKDAAVRPAGARYHAKFAEFVLPYEEVRNAPSPREEILEFFQSVYEAGATRGRWDRDALDRPAQASGSGYVPGVHYAQTL